MLGFIFGTVCLIGLIRVLKAGPAFRGYHGGCGSYGAGAGPYGEGMFARRHRGFRGRWILRSLFERLDTTPGQEKAIVKALDDLRAGRAVASEELKQTRADLAHIISGGLVDDHTFEEVFARHDRALAELRVTFVEAMKVTAEALDDRQRQKLAAIIAGGGVFGRAWARGSRDWDGAWA